MKRTKAANRKARRLKIRKALQAAPRDFAIVCDVAADAFEVIEAAEGAPDGDQPKVRRFSMTAYNGGKMWLNGYGLPVVVDLSGMKVSAKSRPMLRDHDRGKIVGHTESITVNSGSVRLKGLLSAANEHAREIAESADQGFPWQASIGARADRMAFVDDGETVKVNGRSFTGPIYVARQSTLKEISFVAIGADDNTSAKIAAGAAYSEGTEMTFEKWLEAKGFSADELSDGPLSSLQAMYDAEIEAGLIDDDDGDEDAGQASQTPSGIQASAGGNGAAGGNNTTEGTPVDLAAQMREQASAEIDRQNRIADICAQYDDPTMRINNQDVNVRAHAIRENWSLERTELEAMRASRPSAPAGHSRSMDRDANLEAMQAALVLRAAGQLDHESWQTPGAHALRLPQWMRAGINDSNRNSIMERGHRFADMSLIDLCAHALRIDGRMPPSGRQELIEAAFSSGTLTNIFTTNVNAMLLMSYNEAGDTTMGWTSSRDVADFKTNERFRLVTGDNLDHLPSGGTADDAHYSDTGESYKISRFAKKFKVDDQDIINDSMDALSLIPSQMGRAAARLRPDLVYALLFANGNLADGVALFHANHGNLTTSAALAAATLQAGITAIETQTENGVNLNLRPSHLIVPSDLKFTGSQLINSAELRDTTSSTEYGTRNPIQDENLTMVSDSRLSNGVTHPVTGTAYSGETADWYLAAAGAHTIEVGYLRGTGRVPMVRTYRLSEGQWGIGYDVKMDIGAKPLDYRGLYRGEG